jgi:hypothetical protein
LGRALPFVLTQTSIVLRIWRRVVASFHTRRLTSIPFRHDLCLSIKDPESHLEGGEYAKHVNYKLLNTNFTRVRIRKSNNEFRVRKRVLAMSCSINGITLGANSRDCEQENF